MHLKLTQILKVSCLFSTPKNISTFDSIKYDSVIEIPAVYRNIRFTFTERNDFGLTYQPYKYKITENIGLTFIYKTILPTEVRIILHASLFQSYIQKFKLLGMSGAEAISRLEGSVVED